MKTHHTVTTNELTLKLPIREVAPGVRVALFNPLGDWFMNEEVGRELAKLVPAGTEVLVMPDGKAQALLHVVGVATQLVTVVARKEVKPYAARPVLEAAVKSITTNRVQMLYLDADDAAKLKGKRAMILDDVISSGATETAMKDLLRQAEAIHHGTMAAFTEGTERNDVICLGHLPLFRD